MLLRPVLMPPRHRGAPPPKGPPANAGRPRAAGSLSRVATQFGRVHPRQCAILNMAERVNA